MAPTPSSPDSSTPDSFTSVPATVFDLTALLGTDTGECVITGEAPTTSSPHRIAEASAAGIGALGVQLAALAGGPRVTVDLARALDQLRAAFLTTLNGRHVHTVVEDPSALGNNDFYRTSDGRGIFLITTYPHQRDAVCVVLNCPPVKSKIAAAAAEWGAVDLEDAVYAAGGVAAAVRTADEWAEHPVGRESATHPVIRLERIGDAPPRPLPHTSMWPPLHGIRVVDMTHVIAGPVSTKLLATFGADVCHVSRPDLPDPLAMVALTGGGKRNAYCDVRQPDQAAALHTLIDAGDVFVNSYLGLENRGLAADDLALEHPGTVVVDYHCWGSGSAWRDRGGFDQLACSATGFALEEGEGVPALPPTQLLNDYLAAYLGAAGAVAALRRRATEGGTWRVRVELARVCTWVRSLGIVDARPGRPIGPPVASAEGCDGPLGRLVEPSVPMVFEGLSTPAHRAPTLLGTAPLRW